MALYAQGFIPVIHIYAPAVNPFELTERLLNYFFLRFVFEVGSKHKEFHWMRL